MTITNYLRLVALTLFLFSCGNQQDTDLESNQENIKEVRHGGVFRTSIGSYFIAGPINEVQKLEESQIYWQIFEGLVKYNPKTLDIEPALAESWTVSEDGLLYNFNLRENTYFHDNECFLNGKGRIVTVEDVVFSFEKIYDSKMTNSAYSMFKNTIVGGDEYHDGKADEISGISTNENQISIQLEQPSLAFIQKLASVFGSIVAPESCSITDFKLVGTGPFVYDKENSTSEIVRLARNKNYYGIDERGDKLPYLDSVVFVYYDNADDKMDLFWRSELSYISRVPVTKISEVLEDRISDFESKPPKYILNSDPQLTTTYLELNMQTKVLKNKKVRKAFNYAINRKKIKEKILKNQAYEIGKFGITPPLPKVFTDYDFEGIEDVSYVYNPTLAKQLLAEAGYPEGKNFPSLEMQFKSGSTDYLVASEIQNQLRNVLNINIDIEAMEFNQLLENKALGKADICRINWAGDYPTPETFLVNAYGKVVPKSKNEPSYLNSSRYQNSEFDELFEKGIKATDEKEASKYFSHAEKILMDDGVFIILWYSEDLSLKQASLQSFETNSIGYIDLKSTYFRSPIAEEYENKSANQASN